MTAQTEARAVVALAEEMRSGLTGVTPGPWTLIPAIPYDGDDDGLEGAFVEPAGIEGSDGNPVCIFGSALGSGSLFENERDHEHINRCHPDNIRALLDDRDAIAGQNAELRAEIAALKKQVEELMKALNRKVDEKCAAVQARTRAEAEVTALRKALIEARAVVDAVAGHNQPDRQWSRQVRDRIDAALTSTKETSE